MQIPTLKRITVTSEQQLGIWLAKQSAQAESVMLVTHTKASHKTYVSREQVEQMLAAHGWIAGRRYTLNPDLLGHVISKAGA